MIDNTNQEHVYEFGLIGFPVSHSFSPEFFNQKFKNLGLNHLLYKLYPLEQSALLSNFFYSKKENLLGVNVTLPYKKAVLPFTTSLTHEAIAVGAVNCIAFHQNEIIGHNTDVIGFEQSLTHFLSNISLKAIVFGNGGSAQAVFAALQRLHIPYINAVRTVRNPKEVHIENITVKDIEDHQLLINTTPVGMYPHIDEMLAMPLQAINDQHFCYDLIYKPELTRWLDAAQQQGAQIKNGIEMLHLQAEASWEFWNKYHSNLMNS